MAETSSRARVVTSSGPSGGRSGAFHSPKHRRGFFAFPGRTTIRPQSACAQRYTTPAGSPDTLSGRRTVGVNRGSLSPDSSGPADPVPVSDGHTPALAGLCSPASALHTRTGTAALLVAFSPPSPSVTRFAPGVARPADLDTNAQGRKRVAVRGSVSPGRLCPCDNPPCLSRGDGSSGRHGVAASGFPGRSARSWPRATPRRAGTR